MKSTGIVRKVDELGRVVIPIELRRTLGIEEKDALEIYTDNEKIVLKKYEPACIFCGNAKEAANYLISDCMNMLNKAGLTADQLSINGGSLGKLIKLVKV